MAVALLLGARGFLGRNVAAALATDPAIELVRADLAISPPDARADGYLALDLLGDAAELAAVFDRVRPDVIVNCAGRTVGDEAQLRAANVDAVERLLAALRIAGRRPRLIHIGSAAEYGLAVENVPVAEDAATHPAGPYGATKLAGTRLVTAARDRGEVDGVVLRVFNAVGPGMPLDTLPGVAVAGLRAAVAGGADRVEMGPLDAVRDFVDVRDIAAAVVAATGAEPLPPAIVNVGTGRPATARQLVDALARRLGFGGQIVESAAGSARSAAVSWMVADVSLASRSLRWTAAHDLDSIAAAMVADAGVVEPGAAGPHA